MGMGPSGPMTQLPSGSMGMMSSGPMGMYNSMGMPPGGRMLPYGQSRSSIMMNEPPNVMTLDQRPMPPVPTPWRTQEYLMPGQPTGMGMDSISPLQERAVADLAGNRLPSAYRMYGYGPREISWSNPLPVPFRGEENTGIMINAEFPLPKHMEGHLAVPVDHAIRNPHWRHQGEWVQPFDPIHDIPDWKHKLYGDYEDAVDLVTPSVPGAYKRHLRSNVGESQIEQYYKKLHEERNNLGLFKEDVAARRHMELEILNEEELEDFFRNPEAVMRDRLD